MITTNGLNVPAIGEGGRPATQTVRRESRRDNRQRHWVNAEAVRVGDHLRGPKTLGRYHVLDVDRTHDGNIEITVRAPSGAIRHWIRRPGFGLEKA